MLVREVADTLRHGYTVLIHCGAGVGRPGMAAICVLLALGHPLDPAIAAVRRARSHPETQDQLAYVQWAEGELRQ
jgi:protein-tyrosine phosphatase